MTWRWIKLSLQTAYRSPDLPLRRASVLNTLGHTLQGIGYRQPCEIGVRLVDVAESQALNLHYRQKDRPTNVLSFASEIPAPIVQQLEQAPLGDLVICVPVVLQEAHAQHKTPAAHFTHMLVHGTLHLMGHDHETSQQDADAMEAIEVRVLQQLGFANPYE